MAGPADEEYLGVMDASNFLPEGVPSYWAVYVQVDDVDATVARAVELGGAVVQQAEDTPYGRLATISDPTGAAIKLRGPNVSEPQAGAE
jgi:predicted enzyme related to lactoylglutathione lyase